MVNLVNCGEFNEIDKFGEFHTLKKVKEYVTETHVTKKVKSFHTSARDCNYRLRIKC